MHGGRRSEGLNRRITSCSDNKITFSVYNVNVSIFCEAVPRDVFRFTNMYSRILIEVKLTSNCHSHLNKVVTYCIPVSIDGLSWDNMISITTNFMHEIRISKLAVVDRMSCFNGMLHPIRHNFTLFIKSTFT